MTAQEIAMMLVSRLLATVGSETVKIRLAVPAMKLPSAALISSNQLIRESIFLSVNREANANLKGAAAGGWNKGVLEY